MPTRKKQEENLPAERGRWEIIDELLMLEPALTPEEREILEREIGSSVKKILVAKKAKLGKSLSKMQALVDAASEGGKTPIEVMEGAGGEYFIFNIAGKTKSFTLPEMRKMVAMCHEADGSLDAAKRLYRWFDLNRKDVLFDLDFTRSDPRLFDLIEYLMSNYRVKGR